MFNEIIAIITGYLLGSIPSAYIVTRIATGKDIRKLGGGNVGGYNTYKEVGALPSLIVAIMDIGKGVAAIAFAYWTFGVAPLYIMLTGLAAVTGHMWMPWLKFSGGKGVGTTIGALFTIYGYWYCFVIFIGIFLLTYIITRSIPLGTAVSLFSLPFIAWFLVHSGLATILTVVLAFLMGIRFLPTAVRAWKKSKGPKDFISGEHKVE